MYDYIEDYVVSLFKDPLIYGGDIVICNGQMRGYRIGDDLPMEDYGYSYPKDAYLFLPFHRGVEDDAMDAIFLIKDGQLVGQVDEMEEDYYIINYEGKMFPKGTTKDLLLKLHNKKESIQKEYLVSQLEWRSDYHLEGAVVMALKEDDNDGLDNYLKNYRSSDREVIMMEASAREEYIDKINEGVDLNEAYNLLQ